MQIKVASKWDNQQKNMVSQKGIWYQRTKQNGEVFYKLRRYCDEYGRRFFICPDLSKQDGFYTSPTKIQKINGKNKQLSINIPSLVLIEQQQDQPSKNRKSLSPNNSLMKQRKQLQDSQDSRFSDDQESVINSRKNSSAHNNSNDRLDVFTKYEKQDSIKYSSDNQIRDFFFTQNYESQLSPDFIRSSQSSKLIDQQDVNKKQHVLPTINKNQSQKGLQGTDQIPSPKESQLQRRQPYFQYNNIPNLEQVNSNQSNDSQNNDSQFQKSQPFFRSPKKKSNTVTESNFISHQESYKKYMQSKYGPTPEQIEQSEQTPKRPCDQLSEEAKQKLSKISLKKQNSYQIEFSQQQDNFKFECEYITLKCTYYGSLQINEEIIQFISYEDKLRPEDHYHTLNGSHADSLLPKKLRKKIQFLDIQSIHSRRFNMKEIAIEIFTDNLKSYYFNFYKVKSRENFFEQIEHIKLTLLNKLCKQLENNSQEETSSIKKHGGSLSNTKQLDIKNQMQENNAIHDNYQQLTDRLNQTIKKVSSIELIQNRIEYFKQKKYTERWKKDELTNFEYLMLVNQFSSRSYNDITQYPIFPWIFSRYDNQDIDLNNPGHYRNLSKPVGALNGKRLEDFKERYEQVIIY